MPSIGVDVEFNVVASDSISKLCCDVRDCLTDELVESCRSSGTEVADVTDVRPASVVLQLKLDCVTSG